MSEHIGHECGIALVRLLKPLSYYAEKYKSPLWGFEKLFLLMEKQHNRGQDGAATRSLYSSWYWGPQIHQIDSAC